MRVPILCAAVFIAILIAPCFSHQSRAGLFVTPIGGVPYQDWAIVNYVDNNHDIGARDYMGGGYTYDGHTGIDFSLANFAKMDAGVPVLAAMAGTVAQADDGQFDRNTPETLANNPNPLPNIIYIDHGNGLFTKYEHLEKGSINVKVGQHVDAGQQIALVGSSGYSTAPHLHFEVLQGFLGAIDPYVDPNYWWQSPLPYAGTMHGALDYGITNKGPTTVEMENRPTDHPVYSQAPGQQVFLWAQLHGIHAGDSLDYLFLRPDGTGYKLLHWSAPDMTSGSWTGAIDLPTTPDPGVWRTVIALNQLVIVDTSFIVVPEPSSFALATLTAIGSIGWILRRRRR